MAEPELAELFARLRRDVVADVEENLGRRIDTLRDEMNSHFDDVYARFDRLAPVSS